MNNQVTPVSNLNKKPENLAQDNLMYSNLFKFLNPNQNEVPPVPNLVPVTQSVGAVRTTIKKQKLKSNNVSASAALKNKQIAEMNGKPALKFKMNLDFFKRLKMTNFKESFVQQTFLNQKFDNLSQIFDHFWDNMHESKEMLNKQTQKPYYKKVKFDNVGQHLLNNYKIKTFGDKFSIKLFKTSLFEFDRSRFELITSRIVSSNENIITIIYNSKKGLTDKEGESVFIIFAGETQVGTILINTGVVQNLQVINYFSSFFSLVLVELIQMCTQNSGSQNLLHFNLVIAKKFDVEAKLNTEFKNKTINILNNLIDAKLSKFKVNQKPDFDEIFDEDGKIKKSSTAINVARIPNLKFFNYSNVLKKQFTQYFKATGNLENGNLCYKI